MLLSYLIRGLVKRGQLVVVDASGQRHEFGDRSDLDLKVVVRFHNKAVQRRLLINPPLSLGEAYMNGDLSVEEGDIYDLLFLITANLPPGTPAPMNGVLRTIQSALLRLEEVTSLKVARQNVAHHYDLDEKLFRLFLDTDLQYSCAYFMTDRDTLEEAQYNKLRHVASKLKLQAGQRILEIGCGWGGLALYLARTTGASVTGVTLSKEQLRVARERAKDAGLAEQVEFKLLDYREMDGKFDRIVSVAMFEAINVRQYATFFGKMSSLLKEDGVAFLHTIARSSAPGPANQWMRKYIFPGGYLPSLSEVFQAVEKTDLWVTDLEVLRLHYARTLQEWRRRFLLHWNEVAELYDERFCRMWEFYLAACEASFRNGSQMVAHIQLTKRINSLPLTRDYMVDWERSQPGYSQS